MEQTFGKRKVWRKKSLVNLAYFTKSPNFSHQTSYNSTTIISILTFLPNFCTIWYSNSDNLAKIVILKS